MDFKSALNHCEILNGIKYSIPHNEQDYQQCADFYFTHFLPREPMVLALGGQGHSQDSRVRAHFLGIVRKNASIMATDLATGQLLGTRIAEIKEREREVQAEPSFKMFQAMYPEPIATIFYTFAKYLKDWDSFDEFKDLDRIYAMFALATHLDWGGKGIAKELLAQSIKVAKNLGCRGAQVVATNDATIHIFQKLGMTLLQQVPWDEIQVNGKKPLIKVNSEALCNFFLKFA
ncbi:uncharacterized protein LOC131880170 [Tigriopus californicus]|uniref:uncharacterized protein LOC131880170 n=1 Tax=Tigriopus californicus TaxID=6832 RepID=UPI0027DA27B9|nr:uncharacterized protein LOC131880170 [Tigriopus californicus]